MKIKNTELKIVKADVTELETDAIVYAANNQLLMNTDVAGAIKRKGGASIEEEAIKNAPVSVGVSIATKAGSLKSKYVIHAVAMAMDLRTDETKIRLAAMSALKLAEKLQLRSVTLTALGCRVGGFPLVGAAKIMTQEVLKFLRETKTTIEEIIFCLYDNDAFTVFDKTVHGYLEHILYKFSEGPFVTVDAIIELPEGIVLIERSNPPYGLALPGGFVDYGESLEEAVKREAKEETNLELLNLRQFHTYSKPDRDPRFHTISTVFVAEGKGKARFGDDAKGLRVVSCKELLKHDYAFDHKNVIKDYLQLKKEIGKKSPKKNKVKRKK